MSDALDESVVGVRPRRRAPIKPVLRVILTAAVCAVVVLDIVSSHPSYFLLVYLPLVLGWRLWLVPSPVYSALLAGSYDLYVRPFGPVHLTPSVIGGQVTETRWG